MARSGFDRDRDRGAERQFFRSKGSSGVQADHVQAGSGDWFDICAILIRHGHTLESIGDLTVEQLRGFLKATDRLQMIERASHLTVIAIGAQGSGENIERALYEMTKQLHGEREDTDQYIT